jgi:hypothetical protein
MSIVISKVYFFFFLFLPPTALALFKDFISSILYVIADVDLIFKYSESLMLTCEVPSFSF